MVQDGFGRLLYKKCKMSCSQDMQKIACVCSMSAMSSAGPTAPHDVQARKPWVAQVLQRLDFEEAFTEIENITDQYMTTEILCIVITQHVDAYEIMTKAQFTMPGVGTGYQAPSFSRVKMAIEKYTHLCKKNASEEVQAARGKTRQYERMPEFPWVMRVLRDLRLHRTFANMKAKTSEYMAKGILCLLISQHRDAMEIMTKIEAPMPGVGRGVKAPSFGKVLKAAAKYRDECKSWGPLPRLPRASASLTLNRLLPRRVRTSDLLTILVAEFFVGV